MPLLNTLGVASSRGEGQFSGVAAGPTDLGTLVQFTSTNQNDTVLSNGTGQYAGLGNNVCTGSGGSGIYLGYAETAALQTNKKYYFEAALGASTSLFCCIGMVQSGYTPPLDGNQLGQDTGTAAWSNEFSHFWFNATDHGPVTIPGTIGSPGMFAVDLTIGSVWVGTGGTWNTNPNLGGTPTLTGLSTSASWRIAVLLHTTAATDVITIGTRVAALTYPKAITLTGWNTPGS